MTQRYRGIRFCNQLTPDILAETPEQFIRNLGTSTLITLHGKDRSRCRGVISLLHGNEPSGLFALHEWLKEAPTPATDTFIFLGSIEAALHEPVFSHRSLPDHRDMNRCFRPPFDTDHQGHIAAQLIDIIAERQPECIIDIHNTSGSGPNFAVATRESLPHEALTSLFTHRLIVTGLNLGALLEMSRDDLPIVTIECGGARDKHSVETARNGLRRYLHDDDVLTPKSDIEPLDVYHRPVRLELQSECVIAYASERLPGADLTLPRDIELLNFAVVDPNTPIAWLGEDAMRHLRVVDEEGRDVFDHFFAARGGQLYPSQRLKLFMITNNPTTALTDCLLYAAAESGHTIETLSTSS